ncbi:YkgJ family cysteine cluster protein [Nanoarchaeota archaeon]
MNKDILFNLYESIYSKDIGNMDCGSCTWCEDNEETVTLFPFEDEFISKKLGENIEQFELQCKEGKVKSLNKPTLHCRFYKDNRCSRHDLRPVCCRIYPFNPKIEDNKLNLYIDLSCPIANKILENKELTQNMTNICKQLADNIDNNFWESWSSMPLELDNPKRNEKFICFLKEIK